MATPTANYGFIKDAPTQLYDVAVVNANLDAIDAAIDANADAIAALDLAYKAADTLLDSRVDVLENYFKSDAVAVSTTAFTPAAGWSIQEQKLWTWGPVCQIKVSVTRTGAQLNTNSNGNITNNQIATWTAGHDHLKPIPGQEMGFSPADAGIMWGGIISTSAISIVSMPPDTTAFNGLPTGSVLRGSTIYFRNMP